MSRSRTCSRPELASTLVTRRPAYTARSRAPRSGDAAPFFTLAWSAAEGAAPRPMPGASPTLPAAPLGPILIVDDDAAIRDALREILESEGYPISTAADGAAALRQIEASRPALLLLDMRMPGLSGWDVAAALRERQINVPILVMTAARDARHWAEQIGADGYLAKPFDLDDLLDSVARLLQP